jgi:hypothetical protein
LKSDGISALGVLIMTVSLKHCFLITQLGKTKPKLVSDIEQSIKDCCQSFEYKVIDASAERTGRDFLLKIWKIIESLDNLLPRWAPVPKVLIVLHNDLPVLGWLLRIF